MSNQISFAALLGHNSINDVSIAHQQNMQELLKRVNPVLAAFNAQNYLVTSGYRTMQEHMRIYSQKGIPPQKVPLGSAHLSGQAVDIYDPELHLTDWLKNDRIGCTQLQTHDLYCEEGNNNWVHFSTRAPKSGKRWFLP